MMVQPNDDIARAIGARIRASDGDVMRLASFHDDPIAFARERAGARGAKWALVDEHGRALGMGGFEPIMPGTINAWLLGTSEWPARKFEVVRWARRAVRWILDSKTAFRVQAHCFADDQGANRFLAVVGLKHEATLRRYAGGRDVNVWSAVNEDDPVVH